MSFDLESARRAMIQQQVRPWEVLDPRVLEALSRVPREDFVPARYRKLAFADLALPLANGEHMMKPVVEGRMLQALELGGEESVLEVGTGSGFGTACLAHLARAVTSIDIHSEFVEQAGARLAECGLANVSLAQADALAYRPGQQFDAVCVTGAVAELPECFKDWLRVGGRLFVVRGLGPTQEALRLTRTADGWNRESLFETEIDYLRGAEPAARFVF